MNILNCKIISVNPEKSINSVSDFGHKIGSDGRKIRYIERRKNIINFLNSNQTNNIDISIFDAITPKDFVIENNRVLYNQKEFMLDDQSVFYTANFLSHYSIWCDDTDTLILEDDVILEKSTMSSLYEQIDKFNKVEDDSKILYLQISIPWSVSAHEKSFRHQEEFGSFYKLGVDNDVSGTAAYYIPTKTKEKILKNLKPICACDKYLHQLMIEGIINYYVPSNRSLMFKLDQNTMWL